MNHLIHYPILPIYIYHEKANESSNTLPDITNIYTKRKLMNHLIHYPILPIYIPREKANESSNTLIYNIEEVGRDQFENFRHSVFVDGSQAIYTPIKPNNIKLFEERKEKNT